MWKALQPRRGKPPRFGLFPFRSPLLGESSFLSTPPATEMFQFAGFATTRLCIQRESIRESRDQRSFVNFPGLFADFHALHRLLMPRHPPCALSSLTTNIQSSQISAVDALRTFLLGCFPLPGSHPTMVCIARRCHLPLQPNFQRSLQPLLAELPNRQKTHSIMN